MGLPLYIPLEQIAPKLSDSRSKELISRGQKRSQEIKDGCERDIRKVDDRLRVMEKKMWTIFGALSVISFCVSPIGQRVIRSLQVQEVSGRIEFTQDSNERRRSEIYPVSLS